MELSLCSCQGLLHPAPLGRGLLPGRQRGHAAQVNHAGHAILEQRHAAGALRGAGFSPDTTFHAYHVLDAHIIGFSLWQATHDFALPDEVTSDLRGFLDRMLPIETYPDLHAHGVQHMEPGPLQDVSAFEYGLDLLLAGLERQQTPE